MSGAAKSRRAEAEIDAAAAVSGCAGIGSRSIHQFWHLFAAHFRGILLPPRRRPDSGKVAWGWREPLVNQALTAAELAEVRRRLAQASRALTGAPGQAGSSQDADDDSLDAQVRARVARMAADLMAKPDAALAGFVCRDEAGLMLHSWGSAAPGAPSYSDSQQGEISGRLVVEDGDAMGLGVLLENNSGLGVARTKADQAGAFRFQGIAPGSYRLRVAHRSDFPAEGLPIVLEKTALTGVELRSSVRAVSSGDAPVPPAASAKRRRLGGIALVTALVVAAGIIGWRHRPQTGPAGDLRGPDTGWQSARGDLATAGGQAHTDAGHLAGAPVARIALDGVVSAPTLGAPMAGSFAQPDMRENRKASTSPAQGEATPSSDSKSRPAGPMQTDASNSTNSSPDHEQTSTELIARQNATGAPRPLADTSPAVSAGAATATRAVRPGGMSSGLGLVDVENKETPARPASLRAQGHPPDKDKSGPGRSADEEASGSGTGFDSQQKAGELAAATASDRPSTNAGRQNAAPVSGITAHPGPHRPEQAGATVGEGATVVSAENTPAASTAEPSARQSGRNGPGATRRNIDTLPTALSEADTAPSGAVSATSTKGSGTDATSISADPVVAGTIAKPAEVLPEFPLGGLTPSGAAAPVPERLVALRRINAGAWKPTLVRDEILSTFPVADGQKDSLGTLREETLANRVMGMPASFRSPVTWSGFSLDLTDVPGRPGPGLRWRDKDGGEPAGSLVQGSKVELAWDSTHPLRDGEYRLAGDDGTLFARVRVDAGAPSLSVVSGTHASYWVAVGCTVPDRFRWQGELRAVIPTDGYQGYGPWRGQQAARLDFPLLPGHSEHSGQSVSLVDDASGWALACLISGQ